MLKAESRGKRESLGEFIKAARLSRGLTLQRLAAEIEGQYEVKLSTSYLSRLESSKAPAPEANLRIIAQCLGVDIADLVIRKREGETQEQSQSTDSVNIPLPVQDRQGHIANVYQDIAGSCFRLGEKMYAEFRFQDSLNAYLNAEKIYEWLLVPDMLRKTYYRIGQSYHTLGSPEQSGGLSVQESVQFLNNSITYLQFVYEGYFFTDSSEVFGEWRSAMVRPEIERIKDERTDDLLLIASSMAVSASAHIHIWKHTRSSYLRRDAVRLAHKARALYDCVIADLKRLSGGDYRDELFANALFKKGVLLRDLEQESKGEGERDFGSALHCFWEALKIKQDLARRVSEENKEKNCKELARYHKTTGETLQRMKTAAANTCALWHHLVAMELHQDFHPDRNPDARERLEYLKSNMTEAERDSVAHAIRRLQDNGAFIELNYHLSDFCDGLP